MYMQPITSLAACDWFSKLVLNVCVNGGAARHDLGLYGENESPNCSDSTNWIPVLDVDMWRSLDTDSLHVVKVTLAENSIKMTGHVIVTDIHKVYFKYKNVN